MSGETLSPNPIRVAAIGAGAWGKNIVKTLGELGALGCVCESSEALRSSLGSSYDVPVYGHFDEGIRTCDAVAIATPAPTHFEIAREALMAGKDVFVEKPMTLDLSEAEQLRDLAAVHGRILMVGHLLLYQPAVKFLCEQIRSGAIGKLQSVHQERLNLGRARSVEDILWSLGVHDVAVALYLVGSAPQSVQAAGQSVLTPSVADDMYVHCEFAGGVQSHLHCSWLWPDRRRQTTVIGDRAMLVYDELAQKVTLHRKHIDASLANVDEGAEVVFEGAGEPLKLELQHFLDCMRDRSTPISSGESAVDVIRVLASASNSE